MEKTAWLTFLGHPVEMTVLLLLLSDIIIVRY